MGAGALGSAILGYDGFRDYGLVIESVFDSDPEKIGTTIHGSRVSDYREIGAKLAESRPEIAIVCVPNTEAQKVADTLVAAGIRYLWNFANVSLQVPPDVIVQREVIAGGYAMLAVKIKNSRSRHPVAIED